MLTEEEIKTISDLVIERILLRMPEVIGNLMQEQALANKLNKDFYGRNPEFKENIPLVTSVMEQLEAENVGLSYDKLLTLAEPVIKQRMLAMKDCDITVKPKVNELNLSIPDLVDDSGANGAL